MGNLDISVKDMSLEQPKDNLKKKTKTKQSKIKQNKFFLANG